jgi:DNA-3-methyladenine glycosylase
VAPPRLAPLGRRFFARHVLQVARGLVGRVLVHDGPDGRLAGRIVEVEAYGGRHDPASHAYRGPTPRSAIMFGPAGHAYVYLSYGVHHCLNIVAEPEGSAAAVLIRALEPIEGIEVMRARRSVPDMKAVARGPGCVTRALGLDLGHNGLDMTAGPIVVESSAPRPGRWRLASGPRVGIRHGRGRPWRFFLAGHPCVSAGPRGRRGAPVARGGARSALTPS